MKGPRKSGVAVRILTLPPQSKIAEWREEPDR